MNDRFALAGKAALVTGASRGIGRAAAVALAEAGAGLVVAARTAPELERLCQEIRERGGVAHACHADMADPASVRDLVPAAVARLGRLDILVNNAATTVRRPALEVTEEEWNRVIDTNVKGHFFCAQAAGRVMARQGRGKIVNLASTQGLVAAENLVVYCASKGAVIQITRALALEWAKYGINVNAIAPTTTRTAMTAARLADPELHAAYVRDIPPGRVAAPEDILGALLFLASPASDFVTGHTLVVDGGLTTP
jgi:NAD(P)-dependent dehydrogenase (short-subunit alcohol dehydrogenase family)